MGMFKIELDLDFDSIIGERHYEDGEFGVQPNSVEPYRFGDMIVSEVARQLTRTLTDEIRSDLRRQVKERTTALIDERLAPMVDDILAGPIQLTNAYGEPSGKPVSMRDLVLERVSKHLTRTSNRSSYDKTPFDKALDETTAAAVSKELADEVKAARDEIRTKIRATASSVLADAIVKGVTAP